MTDLGWSGWGTIISLLFALIPTLFRFREALIRLQDLITEIAGIVVLIGGLILYAVTVPQWVPIRAQMAQLGQGVESLLLLFFGSIGLMMLGGLLTVFGLLGRITARIKSNVK